MSEELQKQIEELQKELDALKNQQVTNSQPAWEREHRQPTPEEMKAMSMEQYIYYTENRKSHIDSGEGIITQPDGRRFYEKKENGKIIESIELKDGEYPGSSMTKEGQR